MPSCNLASLATELAAACPLSDTKAICVIVFMPSVFLHTCSKYKEYKEYIFSKNIFISNNNKKNITELSRDQLSEEMTDILLPWIKKHVYNKQF